MKKIKERSQVKYVRDASEMGDPRVSWQRLRLVLFERRLNCWCCSSRNAVSLTPPISSFLIFPLSLFFLFTVCFLSIICFELFFIYLFLFSYSFQTLPPPSDSLSALLYFSPLSSFCYCNLSVFVSIFLFLLSILSFMLILSFMFNALASSFSASLYLLLCILSLIVRNLGHFLRLCHQSS